MSKRTPWGERAAFPSTRWSRVVAAADLAAPDARAALEELCAAYWYPMYAFVRRKGNDAEKSLDLTQGYFARLLEKGVLAGVDQRKGRFRAFLRADCEHFLIDQHRRDKAQQRGGGVTLLTIEPRNAEGRYLFEPADAMTPDRLFDRAWAVTLLGRVLELLAAEYTEPGKAELFAHLKVVLTEGKGAISAATLAERLGIPEGTVHTAVHRLKRRYRTILKEQIAATLDDPAQIDDEIRDLFEAIRPSTQIRQEISAELGNAYCGHLPVLHEEGHASRGDARVTHQVRGMPPSICGGRIGICGAAVEAIARSNIRRRRINGGCPALRACVHAPIGATRARVLDAARGLRRPRDRRGVRSAAGDRDDAPAVQNE